MATYIGIEMLVEKEDSRPEEVEDGLDKSIVEGVKKSITVNSYDRDSKAKKNVKNII